MSDEYPNEPGHRGVETSVEAAASVAPTVSRLRRVVLDSLHARPAGRTVDETCEVTGFNRYSLQPRFTECLRLGLIRDTGERRFNVSGRRAIVWAIAPKDEPA